MQRRFFLKAVSLLCSGAAVSVEAKQTQSQKTFVLVHGTWHGAWVWKDVARYLRNMGHIVYCPTLTGCGERKHLANEQVGFETHIKDITNLFVFEELENVILIGHSFSGMIITGVADRIKEKIQHIIFFDALVPKTNPISVIPRGPDGKLPSRWLKKKERFIDGYMMDFWADYPMEMLVPESAIAERERLKRLITPHPAKTWEDEITLHNGGWRDLPRSFIHCVGQTYLQSSEQMIGPARESGWNFLELDIPRDGMLTHPKLLAETFEKMT